MELARTRTDWPLVFLLIGAGVAASTQLGKAPLSIGVIRPELGLSFVVAGLVVSAYNGTSAVIGSLAGIASDAWGHRRLLIVGFAFLALGSLAGSFAPDGAVLVATRFVEGLGFICVAITAPILIGRVAAPKDQRFAMGLFGTNFPTGIAGMMALSPVLLDAIGWRGLWLANSVLCAVLLVALWWATRSLAGHAATPGAAKEGAAPGVTPPRRTLRDLLVVLRSPGPQLLALIFAFYSTVWSGILLWLPTYMVERQGRTAVFAAVVGGVIIFANAIGNLMAARLASRLPSWLLIGGGGLVMTVPALFVFHAATPEWLKYGLALAFSVFGGAIPAASFAAIPMLAPRPQLAGSVMGMMLQGAHIGVFAGPPLLAAVVEAAGGWDHAGWPCFAVTLGIALAAVPLRLVERKRAAAHPAE
jgi:predicted MFS family arabinose efflux permease